GLTGSPGPGTAWPPIRPTRSRGPPAPRRSVPPGCGVLPRPADPPVSLASSLPESSVTFALQRTTLYGPNVTLDRMSSLRSPLRRRPARHRHPVTADPPHPVAGTSRAPAPHRRRRAALRGPPPPPPARPRPRVPAAPPHPAAAPSRAPPPRLADPAVSLTSSLPESSVTFALQRTTLYGPNVTLDRMSG